MILGASPLHGSLDSATAGRIRMVCFDVDGVLTDGGVILGDAGGTRVELKRYDIQDGLGIKMLQQALTGIPGGPIMDPKSKLRGFRPKAGEAYGRIEGPKGEIGFYLISDGGPNPYRYRVRPPSFINLTVLEDMCIGHTIADAVIILGSVDIVLGEVDR